MWISTFIYRGEESKSDKERECINFDMNPHLTHYFLSCFFCAFISYRAKVCISKPINGLYSQKMLIFAEQNNAARSFNLTFCSAKSVRLNLNRLLESLTDNVRLLSRCAGVSSNA